MIHLHRWGKWEDVAQEEETRPTILHNILFVRQRITQKRRCSVCNLLETRTA